MRPRGHPSRLDGTPGRYHPSARPVLAIGRPGRINPGDSIVENDPTVIESNRIDLEEVTNSDINDLVEDELLVEEISIDGMCGVY